MQRSYREGVEKEADFLHYIMNIDLSSPTDTNADCLQINPKISHDVKLELKQLFTEHYLQPERPDVPDFKG